MKKITAFLLALVLAFSLCTMVAATDETVTIVLEPADDTLLTAEGLALFFVDRAAIDEELVRLHSHAAAIRETAALDEPVGRRLDFLVKELNREVNTIGSKASDTAIAQAVVEAKGEIEKLREQVQNIE